MIVCAVIALITIIFMVCSVLIKPYVKIGKKEVGLYWIICLVGAIIMILSNCISFDQVIEGITANTSVNPLKILTLFLSMTLLSVYLGDAGFFDYIADSVFLKSKGGTLKLFLIFYAVVSVLTIFTSNDIIILTFTPPICIFAKKAKISPLPFLFGEFIAANTWSMALIVGNPTNIYLAQSAGIAFSEYFSTMIFPTIAGGLTSLAVLLLVFRKQLSKPICTHEKTLSHHVHVSKVPMLVAICHLGLGIILLAISDFLQVEMYLICLVLALSLTLFDLVYDLITLHTASPVLKSLKKEPYELIPFVLSMFVIVLALKQNGITDVLASALTSNSKLDGLVFGVMSTLSANLLNNIPMSVLFEKVVSANNSLSIYATIIGSNIGAFVTPVGALAGIMWSKILKKYQIDMPFKKFFMYGFIVMVPTLIASVGVLLLVI